MTGKKYEYEGLVSETDREVIVAALKNLVVQLSRSAEMVESLDDIYKQTTTRAPHTPSDLVEAKLLMQPSVAVISGVLARFGHPAPDAGAARKR